jgi:hypothetical protein
LCGSALVRWHKGQLTAVAGGPQDDIKDWMRTLTGHAASIVASALRAQPDGARHLHGLADDRRVDQAIRSAVHAV